MKSINYLRKAFAALVMMFAMVGAFSTKAEAKVEKIKVTAPSGKIVRVAKSKKVKLKTVVKKLKNKKVKYKSKNPKVARVNAKGYVKGIKKGKTRIVVTSKSNPKIKKTVKVVVYKKAVKKIKLNKTKVNLIRGKQFKLNAKVLPKKNVCKKLKFKSSNKKVATITNKGIIRAVAVGTAKITVKAVDGSKKKSTCMVNVKEIPTGIKRVKVRSAFSVDVELTKAKALTYENFKILSKQPDDKEYKDIFDIVSLNTSDNINYEVVIRDTKMFDYKSYLKIVVSGLDGLSEKEVYVDKKLGEYGYGPVGKTYSEDVKELFKYIRGNVGENCSELIDCYDFVKADIRKITVSTLPKGLTASCSADNSYVTIEGVYAEKVNGQKVVIKAVDMNNTVFIMDYYFYVGDEETVYVKGYDSVNLAYKHKSEDDVDGSLRGASHIIPDACITEQNCDSLYDCKDFKASGLPDNMCINEDNNYIKVIDENKDVKAGEYNVTISAITPLGKSITFSFKLILVDGVVVKGQVKDASGKPICDETIDFNRKFYTGKWIPFESVRTDDNGYYDKRLIPGKYDVTFARKNIYCSYCVDYTKSQTYNIKSLCYKVVFSNPLLDKTVVKDDINDYNNTSNVVYDKKGNSSQIRGIWNKQEDDKYRFCLYTYVKKGTYGFGDYTEKLGFSEGSFYFTRLKESEVYKVLTKQFTVKGSCTVKLDLEKVEYN